VVVIVVVVVVVIVAVAAARIGPALRIKGGKDRADTGAKAAHHAGNHVIIADPQGARHQLHRQMPIAQMPGDAHKVGTRDLDQRLHRRLDPDPAAAIGKAKAIARTQGNRLLKIEQKRPPIIGDQRNAAAVAVVMAKGDRGDSSRCQPVARTGMAIGATK